jgi:DNA modification methylase
MVETIFRGLTIIYLALDALILNPRNPRTHSVQQIKALARSIQTFGFLIPIVINHLNEVIAGHGRALAAKLLGLTKVPVIKVEHLSAEQLKAFMIADNRLVEISAWDDRLLAELLSDLSDQELDFSIETTGFTAAEIDLRIEGLGASQATTDAKADAIPAPASGPPVCKPGDLWQLDKHRILCADALDSTSYEVLMMNRKAAMAFTDPPYNVKINGHVTGRGRTRHREFYMAASEMSSDEYLSFLKTMCSLLVQHSNNGSIHYICMDWRHAPNLIDAARHQPNYTLKNICVWVKSNAGMGSFYRSRHEFVLVLKNGLGKHRNNVELGRHGRNRTNVWEYVSVHDFGRPSEEGNLARLHPTVKPTRLIADAILDCSVRGDLVLDCFLGSGSTLIAAQRVSRICRGIELDPLYVDLSIRRWQAFTGEKAINLSRRKTFGELELEVRQ